MVYHWACNPKKYFFSEKGPVSFVEISHTLNLAFCSFTLGSEHGVTIIIR